MSKTIAMLVTSITGNTAKLADAVEQELKQQGHRVKRYDNMEALHAVDTANVVDMVNVVDMANTVDDVAALDDTAAPINPLQADLYMVFFWCRKSTLNDQAQKMTKAIRAKT